MTIPTQETARGRQSHTPGPWTIRQQGPRTRITPHDNEFFTVAAISGFDAREQQANACLVAGAPELLEACKVVRRSLVRNVEALPNTPGLLEIFTGSIRVLDSAITKATGGQP